MITRALKFGSIQVPVHLVNLAEFVGAIHNYEKGDLGYYDIDRQEIWVLESDNAQQMGITFCHEVAHMINSFSAYPEKMNDEIMARLNERWIYLLLKDNASELYQIFLMFEIRAEQLSKAGMGHDVEEFYPEEVITNDEHRQKP